MAQLPTPGHDSLKARLLGAFQSILPQNTDTFNNALKATTGRGYDQLANEGRAAYPDTPASSAHHRLAARLATQALLDKLGWIPGVGETVSQAIPQVAGLGVEGMEAVGRIAGGVPGASLVEHFTSPDTLQDLGANAQGSQEALDEYRRKKKAAFTGSK
jgi:hypothetical protein